MSFVNVIFQSCEHRRFNELKYYVTETETPPGQIKLNLFAWLNAMIGEVIFFFFLEGGRGRGLLRSPIKLLTNTQVFLEVCKSVTTQMGIRARSSGLPRIPGRSCNDADIAVPLYFPNLSFPIQIRHFIGSGLFLFSSKTIPPLSSAVLTDSCVCACIIISFTEPRLLP